MLQRQCPLMTTHCPNIEIVEEQYRETLWRNTPEGLRCHADTLYARRTLFGRYAGLQKRWQKSSLASQQEPRISCVLDIGRGVNTKVKYSIAKGREKLDYGVHFTQNIIFGRISQIFGTRVALTHSTALRAAGGHPHPTGVINHCYQQAQYLEGDTRPAWWETEALLLATSTPRGRPFLWATNI